MIFTLTTLKNLEVGIWHSQEQRVEAYSIVAFFRGRMTFSQLLTVTDGALKLDYASEILVDLRTKKAIKPNFSPQMLPTLRRSLVAHFSRLT